jgi:large subunit ribosomal protein L10
MRKEDKQLLIDSIAQLLTDNKNFYLTDISTLNAEDTSNLRRLCFKNGIKMRVVKNTLLRKAMEKIDRQYDELYDTLKGNTSIMFAETGNVPAKMIKDFRKTNDRPIVKSAFIEESIYIGDENLDFLTTIKSKNELIADVIALLQSPAKNVVSALQSGGNILTGVLKTLSEKGE